MVAPVIIGAGIAAAGSVLSSLINKSNKPKLGKNQQLATQTPEQKEIDSLIRDYIKTGEGPLKDYFPKFNKDEFQQGVANPALRKYSEDILPQILEKYNAGNQALGSGQLRAEIRGQTDLQSKLDELMYNAKNQADRDRANAVLQMLGIHQGKGATENLYTQPGQKAPSTAAGIWSGIANNSDKFVKAGMDAYSNYNTSPQMINPGTPGYSPYTEPVNGASQVAIG
jgi:hypothetical protein